MKTGIRISILIVAAAAPLLFCTRADGPASDRTVAILVDALHSREGRPTYRFDPGEFRYDHAHTTRRLMEHLSANGFSYTVFEEGQLTSELLERFDILFMNVTTASVPFGDDEREAIWKFVADGGGLFWVYEHTNYYGNAMNSDPVMAKFGIQAMHGTAMEEPFTEHACLDSGHWIVVRNFSEHPINRGVGAICLYCGCALETEHGTAFLSENGWVDLGNDYHEVKAPRNRKLDPGEPRGELPIVAATEYEKGRVVAVADHNLIGAQWYGVGDNFKWTLNSFAWLARQEDKRPPLGQTRVSGLQVGFDLEHSKWNIGSRSKNGFHTFHAGFGRNEKLFAHGMTSLDREHDMLIFTEPMVRYNAAELDIVADYFAKGRTVVLMTDIEAPAPGTLQLLRRFAPELRVEVPSGTLTLANIEAGRFTRIEGRYFPIESPAFDTEGLKVAALFHESLKHDRYPGPIEDLMKRAVPYLLDLRTDLGEPFLAAVTEDDRRITIGRRIPVGDGTLILILQARIWMNNTLGFYNEYPRNETWDTHTLHDRFVQWLVDSHD